MTRRATAVAGLALIAAIGLGAGSAALLGFFDDPAAPRPDTAAASSERPSAMDTTFEHFDGRIVRLGDWAGTPMVVNFWASWCPPCVAEMSAAFEPVHQQVGDQVAFVGLNLQDDADDAFAIVRQTGVTYDLGRDPVGELFSAFGGIGMPTTVFIDASGVVKETHTGPLTQGQLQQQIADSFGVEAR